jgi:hypothetical protein
MLNRADGVNFRHSSRSSAKVQTGSALSIADFAVKAIVGSWKFHAVDAERPGDPVHRMASALVSALVLSAIARAFASVKLRACFPV